MLLTHSNQHPPRRLSYGQLFQKQTKGNVWREVSEQILSTDRDDHITYVYTRSLTQV